MSANVCKCKDDFCLHTSKDMKPCCVGRATAAPIRGMDFTLVFARSRTKFCTFRLCIRAPGGQD